MKILIQMLLICYLTKINELKMARSARFEPATLCLEGGNIILHGLNIEKDIKKTAIMFIKIEVNVISVSNFAVFL